MTEIVDVLLAGDRVPEYSHPGDAGADLRAAETVTLAPGERATVGTGTAVALPAGYAGLVLPRSGLAARHGISIVNAPGLIDAGYRGEIKVTVINTDVREPYTIHIGDRVAQLMIQPVAQARFTRVDRLPGSQRGSGGFGSTGYSTNDSGDVT